MQVNDRFFNTYQTDVLSHESTPDVVGHDVLRMLHAALGVTTEVAELMDCEGLDEVALAEELGDVCWYIALLMSAVNRPLSDASDWADDIVSGDYDIGDVEMFEGHDPAELSDAPFEALVRGAIRWGAFLNDRVKRRFSYGNTNLEEWKDDHYPLSMCVGALLIVITAIAASKGMALHQVLSANALKLSKRYGGEGFDAFLAMNRDLTAERDAMVGGGA